jgi:hypothetical protein
MKRLLLVVLMALGAGGAQASLVGRDINGNAVAGNAASSVFLYDTVLNITWLRNANAGAGSIYDDLGSFGGVENGTTTDGRMTWTNAVAWANSLNGTAAVGGTTGWRLPTMIDSPDITYSTAGGTDAGYNVRTKNGIATQYQQGQTVYSEMAHLWYSTLGNKTYCPPGNTYCSGAGTPQPGWGLTNTDDFQNLQANGYWSGLEYWPNTSSAWLFLTDDGYQTSHSKTTNSWYALAVRPGDVPVPAAVPIPATVWLMLSGIGALGAAARRKAKAVQP